MDFPGGPVFKILCFHCREHGFEPWSEKFCLPCGVAKKEYWKDICCCSFMSDSLRPHGRQHARLPCPSPSPRACSNSCPLSRWCHPTISSCHSLLLLLSIFPSIRVFSNESALHIRWPKNWSFSFSISASNEYLGLISFRIDWFDLLVVQVTLNSLLQHHHSKAPILWHSVFFMVQLCKLDQMLWSFRMLSFKPLTSKKVLGEVPMVLKLALPCRALLINNFWKEKAISSNWPMIQVWKELKGWIIKLKIIRQLLCGL